MLIRFLTASDVDVTRDPKAPQIVSFPKDEVAHIADGIALDLIRQGIARAATEADFNAPAPTAAPVEGSAAAE